jgi:peptidoglycan/LPS O-acetylase OafA/YrhL
MLAAMAVLFSHCFALAIGSGDAEPLRLSLGLTWGDIAVDVFFITSGFLVTASLLSRRSAIEFMWARGLRIFPGLWVMLLLTTFGLGLFFTSESVGAYLGDRLTWKYLLKNAVLFRGVEYFLPRVFGGNPWKNAVNGSLWTLPTELAMYGALLGMWLVARLSGSYRLGVFKFFVVAIALASGSVYLFNGLYFTYSNNWPRLFFMFFGGASFFVLRKHIGLSGGAFWTVAGTLLVSSLSRTAFFFVFNAAIGYLTFYLAYGFGGRIRAYNRLGDYSYGVYIYAYPTQQTFVALVPGISPWLLIVLSAPATLAQSALSWRFIESRAIALKEVCANETKRRLNSLWPTKLFVKP